MTAATMVRSNTIADAVMVFKPRIAFAIMLSTIGGLAVAQGPMPDPWQATLLSLAVFLAAGSAGAFNQWVECDLDAAMKRTANRPFVTGQFKAGPAWLSAIIGLLAISVGMAGLATNWWAALYTFLQPGIYAYVNHNLIEAAELGATAHFKVEGAWDDDLMKQVSAPGPIG